MNKIYCSILLLFYFCSVAISQQNDCGNNAGFESGTTAGWVCWSGYYGGPPCPSAGACPRLGTVYTTTGQLNPGGINAALGNAADRHVIVTGAGIDPNSVAPNLVPVVAPGGGTYSFRLGNNNTGTVNGNNSQAEAIDFTFPVTTSNAGFTYRYSFFVNNPGHTYESQPSFEVIVKDASNNQIPCGHFSVVAGNTNSACGNTVGFFNGNSGFVYQPWTDVGLDLTGYIGTNITIEFRTTDCDPAGGGTISTSCVNNLCTYCANGNCCTYTTPGPQCTPSVTTGCANYTAGSHSAYAYIDAYCSPLAVTSPVFCAGAASITICAPAGYASYTWPSGQPGLPGSPTGQCVTINNPVAGNTYTVNMLSVTGCPTTTTVLLNGVTPSVSAASTICTGGSATITATGGGTYSWNTGATSSSIVVSPSSTSNYSVVVTNGGCSSTIATTVSLTSLNATTSAGTTICGGTTTTLTANGSGGVPGYTYSWSPSGQTSQTATGLTGGTYTATVTDAQGCKKTSTVTVTQSPSLTNTVSSTPAGCSVSNGTATGNPSGGTPGYTYVWSPSGQTSQTATGLSGGTHTVVVSDSRGCTRTTTVNIGSTTAPTATASSTQSTCAVANGTGTANPSGGTPGYTYSWSNGQTTQTATGFAPGTHTVLVTDANGCTATASISITAANGPTVTITSSNTVTCNGGSNGSATATPVGGTPNYTYSWSNGQTTQTATGLTAGSYTVIVTDANGCSFTLTTAIAQPPVLSLTASSTSVACNGGTSNATATPTGGTPGYTYSWSNGQTSQTATGLIAGNYTVTTWDANGCTGTTTVSVTQPTALTSTISSTSNASCNGGSNGSATVTPSGGTPIYTFNWSNGQTTPTATGLTAGNYSVVITDANSCTRTSTVTIAQPTPITLSSTQTNILCLGGTGTGTGIPSGGTPGYTYLWSNGQTTQTATGLIAGSYTVTVTDANGCTGKTSFTLTQPQVLANTISGTNILCNGGNNGSAIVSVSGGTPAYTYLWSPGGQTTASVTGLPAGNYSVVITDVNGCKTVNSVFISEPPPLILSLQGNDSICKGITTVLNAIPSGGSPAYTFVWNPAGQTTASIAVSPTSSTSYSVSVTDASGCVSGTQVFNLTILPQPIAGFDTISAGPYSPIYSFTDLSSGGIAWYWNFGTGTTSTLQNPYYTFPGAGTYLVWQVVYNQYGCPDTARKTIYIPEYILIPNVFTPNHDGHNDEFYIPNSGMKEFHIQIFDRWGLKVYETTADEIRWDGRSTAGKLLSDGTYYFVLQAFLKTSSNGVREINYNGYVTLLTNTK